MSNCYHCQRKFLLFKLNKTKCMECGQGYCHNCIRKSNGLCFSFKSYCEICLILNTRPVNRRILMNLRPKEVKLYLTRRKIPTENCLEKEELVDQFLTYVEAETTRSKFGNKKSNYLNGFMHTLAGSMPNLFEGPRTMTSQTRAAAEEPIASSSYIPERPSTFAQAHQQFSVRPEVAPSTSNDATNIDIPNDTPKEPPKEPPKELPKKLIRLSDIKDISEISNLSVKQLKELLFINRVDFKGCVEKEELTDKASRLWEQSQIKNPEELPTEDLCKICMDAPLNCVLLECGHIATCIDCGKQLAECPICRQYVVRVVHTFKA